jgi:thiol-disulfide isomerase/thioredoxin
MKTTLRCAAALLIALAAAARLSGQEQFVRVDLAYHAPGNGPAPNFSPKGMQVTLAALAETARLPDGAAQPAKSGVMKVGPDQTSWVPVLAAADTAHPKDFSRLFVDRNRNGDFTDDGPALSATPTQNEKTKAWWSSFSKVELSIPYGHGVTEPYFVNFWIVREDEAPAPDVLRFSVGSWRSGTVTVNGIAGYVAMMDSDNDALFKPGDMWSVLQASAPNAEKAVLSIAEARATNRFMFLRDGSRELVLEFRSVSPDGRALTFAVVNRPMTKAADRAPDDMVGPERSRPRATAAFAWGHALDVAQAAAKKDGKYVFIDFETTWCGPCHSMDEWIWTDAEVASKLNAGYVGVKLDGDIEKALVKRYKVVGYPTMIVLDGAGKEVKRLVGYQSSKEMLAALTR